MIRALFAMALLATPATAFAQAFPMPKGEGRVITSVIYSNADRGFDDDANAPDIPDYERLEVAMLAEYGITDRLTLVVAPSVRGIDIDGSGDETLTFADVGARYTLSNSGGVVVAAQGTVRIPGQGRRNLPFQIGSTDLEYDVRGQVGAGLVGGHFLIGEAGYRHRAGDPPDQFHIDATAGVRVAPRILLIANSFNVISAGSGRGVAAYRYHNVYLSGAVELSERVTFQLGALGTVAGRNGLRERGGFASLWLRF